MAPIKGGMLITFLRQYTDTDFDLSGFKTIDARRRSDGYLRVFVVACVVMLVYSAMGYHEFMAYFALFLTMSYAYTMLQHYLPTQVSWPIFCGVMVLSFALNVVWLVGILQLWLADQTLLRFGGIIGLYSLMISALTSSRDTPLLAASDFAAVFIGVVAFPLASLLIVGDATEALMLGTVLVMSYMLFLFRMRAMKADAQRAVLLRQKEVDYEKMSALGRLTGGVAHDFNNMLTVISGNLELINETEDPVQRAELVAQAHSASQRAAEITSQLLVFSRQAVLSPRATHPKTSIQRVANMLENAMPDNVAFAAEIQSDLPDFVVDVAQFEAVVTALCLNARDAMPGGGKLDLLTARYEIDASGDSFDPVALPPGSYVHVCVADTGVGIISTDIKRVCEPYYSTKGRAKGSGLGLAMAKGFAEQSGGTLQISSAIGVGTRVSLYFPAARQH